MIPITRALTAEHQMFNAVFDQVEAVLPGMKRLEELRRLARLVEGLLVNHAKVESDLLMLAKDLAPADNRHFARCLHEHHEIDSQLTRVRSAQTLAHGRKLFRQAMAASRAHFAREERTVFPLVEKGMQPEELTKLGTFWLLQRHAPPRWTL